MATATIRSATGAAWQWVARIAAIGVFAFFMMFVIGEGFPPLGNQPLSVQLEFAAWGIIFVGYLVGWNLPLAGGLISLAGLALFNGVELWTNGRFAGPWIWLFGLPAVLYVAAAMAKRRTRPTT